MFNVIFPFYSFCDSKRDFVYILLLMSFFASYENTTVCTQSAQQFGGFNWNWLWVFIASG